MWHLSHNAISVRFVQIIVYIDSSFTLLAGILLCEYTTMYSLYSWQPPGQLPTWVYKEAAACIFYTGYECWDPGLLICVNVSWSSLKPPWLFSSRRLCHLALLLADADLRCKRPQLPPVKTDSCFHGGKRLLKKDQQLRTEVSIVCIVWEIWAAGYREFGSEIIR
jgi:hypothetical protein